MLIKKTTNENAHLPYSLGSLEFALGHIYYLAFPFFIFYCNYSKIYKYFMIVSIIRVSTT